MTSLTLLMQSPYLHVCLLLPDLLSELGLHQLLRLPPGPHLLHHLPLLGSLLSVPLVLTGIIVLNTVLLLFLLLLLLPLFFFFIFRFLMFPFAASLPPSQLSGRFLALGILLGELEITKRNIITTILRAPPPYFP